MYAFLYPVYNRRFFISIMFTLLQNNSIEIISNLLTLTWDSMNPLLDGHFIWTDWNSIGFFVSGWHRLSVYYNSLHSLLDNVTHTVQLLICYIMQYSKPVSCSNMCDPSHHQYYLLISFHLISHNLNSSLMWLFSLVFTSPYCLQLTANLELDFEKWNL